MKFVKTCLTVAVFLTFLALLLALPVAGGAHDDDDMPLAPASNADWQHIWARPDCSLASEIFVLTGRHGLHAGASGARLEPLTGVSHKGDLVWELAFASGAVTVRLTHDGLMNIMDNKSAWLLTSAPAPDTDSDGQNQLARCFIAPETRRALQKNLALTLTALEADCEGGTLSLACREALFDAADDDGNGQIDQTEMEIAAQTLLQLSLVTKTMSENLKSVPLADLQTPGIATQAEAFLQRLQYGASKNENESESESKSESKKQIVFAELAEAEKALHRLLSSDAAEAAPMRAALESLAAIFPALRPPPQRGADDR